MAGPHAPTMRLNQSGHARSLESMLRSPSPLVGLYVVVPLFALSSQHSSSWTSSLRTTAEPCEVARTRFASEAPKRAQSTPVAESPIRKLVVPFTPGEHDDDHK